LIKPYLIKEQPLDHLAAITNKVTIRTF